MALIFAFVSIRVISTSYNERYYLGGIYYDNKKNIELDR